MENGLFIAREQIEIERTYRIPETNIRRLEDKFASLRRRAVRLNCEVNPPQFHIERWDEQLDQETQLVSRFAVVRVTGDSTSIGGHKLVAILSHAEDTNVINTVPGVGTDALFAAYGEASPKCDFCHTDRQRNDTFLIRETETGEIKQIGRNCLQYYFAGMTPEAVAARLEWLIEADQFCGDLEDESFGGGGRGPSRYDVEAVLTYTACVVRRFGYVSVTTAEERGVTATTDIVKRALFERDRTAIAKFRDELKSSDVYTAREVLDWVRNELEPSSDYEWNVKRLCELNSVEARFLGYVISAYRAYFRKLENDQREAVRRDFNAHLVGSQHTGTVGEMTNFPACKVIFHKECASEEWGVSHLFKMLTEEGNVLVTFTRAEDFVANVNVGDVVHVRCKIKEHSEYEGVKQTVVSHIKTIDEDYARGKTKKPAKKRVESERYSPMDAGEAASLERYQDLATIPVDESVGF